LSAPGANLTRQAATKWRDCIPLTARSQAIGFRPVQKVAGNRTPPKLAQEPRFHGTPSSTDSNLVCADGFVHGSDGCSSCACRAAATCAGATASCVYCPFGYRSGPNNCRTCDCEDPPSGCAVAPTPTGT